MSPPTAEPTGGTRTFRADVRLIAASNRDLSEAVAAEILGLKRTTLEARMKKLGIRRQALEFSIHFFGWPQEKCTWRGEREGAGGSNSAGCEIPADIRSASAASSRYASGSPAQRLRRTYVPFDDELALRRAGLAGRLAAAVQRPVSFFAIAA